MTIRGQRQYLWRAVDQDGEVIDILLQPRWDGDHATRPSEYQRAAYGGSGLCTV